MAKELIVRNVPPDEVDELVAAFKVLMEGATVTRIEQPDGSFTIMASGLEGDPTTDF
jgi:hypothetical protein